MSEYMRPVPFESLLKWIFTEYRKEGTIFGVSKFFYDNGKQDLNLFKEKLEIPFGPAAGPHTQLTQNLVSAYITGARFFELKTVQIIDGKDLPVNKPCIWAGDEGYNCEWSTELTVPDAMGEYIKGWVLLKVLAKEFGFGDPDGFIFNMSVGYDYEGITSKKIDDYINNMRDASGTEAFKEAIAVLLDNLDLFEKVDADFIKSITPHVSDSITLSTLHGCPPDEIERIASYLINTKGLNTFIKCNPTMLGYETARKILDEMGYDYMDFDDYHFTHDLQYKDAVPMIGRLKEQAKEKGVTFGVKITNTFPQKVVDNLLPDENMYMSGRSLFPVSIELAARLAKTFDGDLRISYSGGADVGNIDQIFETGIWPITVATTLLKPGGYNRCRQIANKLEKTDYKLAQTLKPTAVEALAKDAITNEHYTKNRVKKQPTRKSSKKVPVFDCFTAPCQVACPISQNIPDYVELLGQDKPLEALQVITATNPLPFITGTICNHRCMDSCTRNFYESPICIRDAKLNSATLGFDDLLKQIKKPDQSTDKKVAVIGGGPAGMASAFFLASNGVPVTVFERKDKLGGIVEHVIPNFRIDTEAIENDIALLNAFDVDVVLNKEITDLNELREDGYDYIITATGAWKNTPYSIEGDETMEVLPFLERSNMEDLDLGENVIVVGGGNTAMDAARTAKRNPGVKNVDLLYRRTIRYMPADEEELQLALEDGVNFYELISPEKFENGKVTARVMKLGAADESGRRRPEPTDETVEFDADTVIAAIGQVKDDEWLLNNGFELGERGKVALNPENLKATNGVYLIGDVQNGALTVVEAIADARKATDDILKDLGITPIDIYENTQGDYDRAKAKRGTIAACESPRDEHERCLECSTICESCADVCPNRANIAVIVPGLSKKQIIHIDRICNECGNCIVFCPYDSAPYKDKFTLFNTEEDFRDSKNEGVLYLDGDNIRVRIDGDEIDCAIGDGTLNDQYTSLIRSIKDNYAYLI